MGKGDLPLLASPTTQRSIRAPRTKVAGHPQFSGARADKLMGYPCLRVQKLHDLVIVDSARTVACSEQLFSDSVEKTRIGLRTAPETALGGVVSIV
jgi:hypothetical protein